LIIGTLFGYNEIMKTKNSIISFSYIKHVDF